MNRVTTLFGAVLLVSILASGSALARGAGGGRARPPKTDVNVGGGVPEAQEPINWMADYDEACKVAAEESRAMLILISTDALEKTSSICSFDANVLRKVVRESKVVPVKLLPPVMLDTAGLNAEEIKQRQAAFKKARERYEALAKRFGVQVVPSVIYCAPDAAKLTMQSTPADQEIMAVLARLPEMVKAHNEAVVKAGADKKPEPVAVAKDPPKGPEPKPPEDKAAPKPGNPGDDF